MIAVETRRRSAAVEELAKLGAFLRRDLLIAWSYRALFATEWVSLAVQALAFYFVSRLVNPAALPSYGGTHATYMQFVAVGMVVAALLHLATNQIAQGIRVEQLAGTLESLLLTPTASATIQLGTVLYDALYIPIRMIAFLAAVALAFGLRFDGGGVLPSLVLLAALLPFVWGIGIMNAATTLTFRRGGSGTGLVMILLGLGSGAYFPLSVLPPAVARVLQELPPAVALSGIREALIGGEGWSVIGWNMGILLPASAVSIAVGLVAFRLALRRERRRGSLALY